MSTFFLKAHGIKELALDAGIELDQTKLINSTFESLATDLSLKSSGASGTITIRKSDDSSIFQYSESEDRIVSTTNIYTDQTIYTDTIIEAVTSNGTTINDVLILDGTVTLGFDPTDDLHSTTKQYVDNLIDGLKWKEEALAGTTGNIDLSTGGLTPSNLDTGITPLSDESRVFVHNQTDATENGIYNAHPGSWTRSTDANTGAELVTAVLFVNTGDTHGNRSFVCTNSSITEWTTDITFILRSSGMNHNDLANKQGGTSSEYYHITSAEHTELTQWLDDVVLSNGGSIDIGSGSLTTSTKIITPEIEDVSGILTMDIQSAGSDSNLNISNSTGGGTYKANLSIDGQIKVDNIVENTLDDGVTIENCTIEDDGSDTILTTSGNRIILKRGSTTIAIFS